MRVTAMSPEQIMDQWEALRTVKNLMGKYVNCRLLNRVEDLWPLFWSKTMPDVSLGLNDGYYVGPEAIQGYFQAVRDGNMKKAKLLQASLPDRLGSLSDEELYGVGPFHVHPLGSPVIEVAEDGKTAKGIWHCMGAYADVGTDGPSSSWLWGYYAGDFILEDGQWRIWHLLFLRDVDHTCGESWAEPERPREILPEFAAMAEYRVPEPTVKKTQWTLYAPRRPHLAPPRIPEPYDTFDHTFSYGAEGGIL